MKLNALNTEGKFCVSETVSISTPGLVDSSAVLDVCVHVRIIHAGVCEYTQVYVSMYA